MTFRVEAWLVATPTRSPGAWVPPAARACSRPTVRSCHSNLLNILQGLSTSTTSIFLSKGFSGWLGFLSHSLRTSRCLADPAKLSVRKLKSPGPFLRSWRCQWVPLDTGMALRTGICPITGQLEALEAIPGKGFLCTIPTQHISMTDRALPCRAFRNVFVPGAMTLKNLVAGGGYLADLTDEGATVLDEFQSCLTPDGKLGMCRLAGAHDWARAETLLQRQASMGGILLRFQAADATIKILASADPVHKAKKFYCDCAGQHTSKGGGIRATATKKVRPTRPLARRMASWCHLLSARSSHPSSVSRLDALSTADFTTSPRTACTRASPSPRASMSGPSARLTRGHVSSTPSTCLVCEGAT
jgi:hypothetical protein